MALALDIVKGGFSPQSAKCIQGQVQPAISAAGTTQGTATTLTASINVITTAAALSGVILPSCEVGDEVDICNLGVGTVIVYPDSGSRVNGLSTNSGFQLAPNTSCKIKRFTTTRWLANLSA